MSGNRMDTDIISGPESGMSTVLVLSSVSTRGMLRIYAYRLSAALDGAGDIAAIPVRKSHKTAASSSSGKRWTAAVSLVQAPCTGICTYWATALLASLYRSARLFLRQRNYTMIICREPYGDSCCFIRRLRCAVCLSEEKAICCLRECDTRGNCGKPVDWGRGYILMNIE